MIDTSLKDHNHTQQRVKNGLMTEKANSCKRLASGSTDQEERGLVVTEDRWEVKVGSR